MVDVHKNLRRDESCPPRKVYYNRGINEQILSLTVLRRGTDPPGREVLHQQQLFVEKVELEGARITRKETL